LTLARLQRLRADRRQRRGVVGVVVVAVVVATAEQRGREQPGRGQDRDQQTDRKGCAAQTALAPSRVGRQLLGDGCGGFGKRIFFGWTQRGMLSERLIVLLRGIAPIAGPEVTWSLHSDLKVGGTT